VLADLLGEDFGGILTVDYYSANRSFARRHEVQTRYCWSHLLRDVKFLRQLGRPSLVRWADGLPAIARQLFRAWHRRTPGRSAPRAPADGAMEAGVEPTNDATERAIRQPVLQRRITQGTRGERGLRWCERAWTAAATCTQQGRSAFRFFRDALAAYLTNTPAPSLLPVNP